jgi:hypothetical protein
VYSRVFESAAEFYFEPDEQNAPKIGEHSELAHLYKQRDCRSLRDLRLVGIEPAIQDVCGFFAPSKFYWF